MLGKFKWIFDERGPWSFLPRCHTWLLGLEMRIQASCCLRYPVISVACMQDTGMRMLCEMIGSGCSLTVIQWIVPM